MDNIDLRTEHRDCMAELTVQKELYLTLVLKLQELTGTIKPNLEALYAVKIGHKELELLQKRAEVAGLKYQMELMVACINKKEKIDREKIRQIVQEMLEDYYDKINREAERIDNAQNRLAHLMLPADSFAMKKLYYEAAKLLHPDVNPNLSDEQKQLWNVISEAYKYGDLQTVRNVTAAIESMAGTPKEIYEYDSLKTQVELFKERNKVLLYQITTVQADFPFTFSEKLHNEEWLKSEYLISDCKMQELNETAKKYLDFIDLITNN